MRYIDLHSQAPNQTWSDKAAELLEELKAAPDSDARNKIIDANRIVWAELKDWLLSLSHGKCWFSEARDIYSHWDVEHYRPKKFARDESGTPHDAYWWLAFDWRNLRICGNVGNRKKGNYFPLRDGCARCPPHGDIRLEDPLLLDPADPADPALLSFSVEGRAIVAADVDDAWERRRVTYSVEKYNLDFPPLMEKRKVVWQECWNRVQECLQELKNYQDDVANVIAKDRYKEAIRWLRGLMRPEKELSAVARACVLSTGDRRLVGLLQSA